MSDLKDEQFQNFSEAIEGQQPIKDLLIDIKQMMGDKVLVLHVAIFHKSSFNFTWQLGW